MLSRVAERMYWLGRYMERAENTALLLRVNTNFAMDVPDIGYIWSSLINITGDYSGFRDRYSVENEQNVVKFLMEGEGSSIRSCIRLARENARTTREIMPREAFEKINKLYHYVAAHSEEGLKRTKRHEYLSRITDSCQEMTGYLIGCMSASNAYHFIKLGRNLERADMTTRILDVGCINLNHADHPQIDGYENIFWVNMLKSLSAYQMYRQHVNDRINGEDVAAFLLKDPLFPRSVSHTLIEVNRCFAEMPNNVLPLRSVGHAQRAVTNANVIEIFSSTDLHQFIDDIQLNLAKIHDVITQTWFNKNLAGAES